MVWQTSDYIAAVAAVISLVALFLTWFAYRAAQHAETLKALQGERESIAFAAYSIGRGRVPRSKNQRQDLIRSLCLAAMFESSDRSRALIYEALIKLTTQHADEIWPIVDDLDRLLARIGTVAELDVKRGTGRLTQLRRALGDTRTVPSRPAT
jgi:hypothetical protein